MSNNVPLPCRSSRQPMLPATLAHGELASHAVESSSRPQPRNPDAQATPPTRSPANDARCDRPTRPNYFSLACCVTTRSAMPVPRNGGSLRIISHAPSKAYRSSQALHLENPKKSKHTQHLQIPLGAVHHLGQTIRQLKICMHLLELHVLSS